MAVLSFDSVTLSAHLKERPVELLRDISFILEKGEVIGLVGESGAGKSMIGRVISGLLPDNFSISSGEVRFEGLNLLNLSKGARRDLLGRRIAFIPQEPLSALNPVRTVGDQFREHLKHLGIAKDAARPLMIERLQQVGLSNAEEMLMRYSHELSGGQCQRVLIAMAFSGEPALVVADEPTTALDVVTQAQIMRLIAEQQAQHGTAVLFITHDLRLAANVCKSVGVMYAGDMVEFGPAAAVLQSPSHPYTKSLLAAIPRMTGERRMLPTLSEQMPGLRMFSSLAGCRFAQRCPAKDVACVNASLERRFIGHNHWTRCGDTCGHFEFASGAVLPTETVVDKPQEAPAVEFQNVRLQYQARRGFLGLQKTSFDAVRSASFKVRSGEILGIVGESGSGKSSIGRLIVGLEKSTEGKISIAGEERDDRGSVLHLTRRDTQLIFQDPQSALNPRRSVLQLLTQGLEVGANSLPAPERRAAADGILQDIGLPADCLSRFPSQLSGGQRQRVNIGRALCLEPRLVVADEIVSGLDVSVQAHILNCLLELNRQKNLTMVFISHDLGVVRYLCNRILMMYRGEIVEEGETEEVFARPKHPYTKLLMDLVPS